MFGKHALYIIPSYALTGLIIALLIIWIITVYRSRQKEIAELEQRGISRGGAISGASNTVSGKTGNG